MKLPKKHIEFTWRTSGSRSENVRERWVCGACDAFGSWEVDAAPSAHSHNAEAHSGALSVVERYH